MANNPETHSERLDENVAERNELKNLEKKKSPEKNITKAEIEKGERDLALKREQAEKHLGAEREKRELDLARDKEKAAEKQAEKVPEKKDPKSYTPAQKKTVYKTQMKHVQAQLPRGSRAFSKVIHNTAVEKVSDVAGKTIFRPSALVGGAVTGLVLGGSVYVIAQFYGYSSFVESWMLPILLIIGAVLGVAVELIINLFRHKDEE